MPKPRIALLVNFIAPSRVAVYERLGTLLDLIILHGGPEKNRSSWNEITLEAARVRRVSGWQLSMTKRDKGKPIDHWFLHLEPGYIIELLRERPEAVITDEMGFRTLVGLAYGKWFHKPVWVWWGGTPHTERHVGWFRKFLRGMVARWAEHWISYGQTSTEYLLSLGISREKVLQVQNCVDESWYGAEAEAVLEVGCRPMLLHVGRMVAGKGIAEFLHAAARLQREGIKFSIVLVGEGRDSAKLQQLAEGLQLKNIRFYPAQPPKAMPVFYRGADVLVFSTMTDVWGLVANEAILSGVPVLCSQYAGCAVELFDCECIFDPADENQFVNALRKAVTGQLPRADRSRLWSSAEVGDVIANAVLASCRGKNPTDSDFKAETATQSALEN
ncbi:MAG TPA: glycosyltransferase [Candidatus Acidoferrales bacterium]